MKIKTLPILAALCFVFATLAHAQTTYTVVPSQCGIEQPTLSCIVDLSPETSAGVYPTMRVYQINYRTAAEYQGYIEFSTVQTPKGYVGYAQVYSSVPISGGVRFYFAGSYVSGGTYTGEADVMLTYRTRYLSGRWVPYVTAQSGTVTIN